VPADQGPYGLHRPAEPPCQGAPADPLNEVFGRRAIECRLLVVDDDADMRNLASSMAECFGYVVRTAASGEAALRLLQNGNVDVVITDYKMPWMNGAQLAAEIRHRHPGLAVILMTGCYGQYLDEHKGGQDLFDGVLEKPFNLNALRKAIAMGGRFCAETGRRYSAQGEEVFAQEMARRRL
jgi:CheY-like chemotaxis protein